MSTVLATAPASPDETARQFAARPAFGTDVSDVHADLQGDATVVTCCRGSACSGATRAAPAFARPGYRVKESIGGYEYRVREGFAAQTATGRVANPVGSLTAPVAGAYCGCRHEC
ncbi:rhodanese-like domain-containing protein [Actinoallomurus soli]|uniref:rhodanese-like domain-containing protein n=1 Tax=Actinoallomurus soli TaxID=2952535 RepID=UPI002092FD17|nr:rhodanese-like domain-containing protein [Actinoallomurus soli]MCO5974963.1 rhodanese-like domain-containing protein [Actinoallomurus soli]